MELWCNIEQHQQVQHIIGDYWARDKHYYSSFDLAASTLPQPLTWHPCEIHLETRGNSCKLTGNWSMAEQSRAVGGWSWSRRWKPGSQAARSSTDIRCSGRDCRQHTRAPSRLSAHLHQRRKTPSANILKFVQAISKEKSPHCGHCWGWRQHSEPFCDSSASRKCPAP